VNELKPLICPSCGGRINASRMRCEYCGTQFKREEGPVLRIEAVNRGVRTIEANARIAEYYLKEYGEDTVGILVKDQILHQLTKALLPMLELEVGHDLQRCEAIVQGRIRVLEPGYRF